MRKTWIKTAAVSIALMSLLAGCTSKDKTDGTVSSTDSNQEEANLSTTSEEMKTPESKTIQWINTTYAILTTANNGDINLVGGSNKHAVSTSIQKNTLESWWDVTDRLSAEENMNWLLNEGGHRQAFLEEYTYYGFPNMTPEQAQAEISLYVLEDQPYLQLIYDAYAQFGEHAIDAWDYCRATQLLASYYLADYYTYEEAMDQSLEICKLLQQTYRSWDEMVQSYLYGYQYWMEDDINDPDSDSYARLQIYEQLKASDQNPYEAVDWNMELVKDW